MTNRIEPIQDRMRAAERDHDRCAPVGVHLVARLDGRGFHRLTRDIDFAKPYDERFRDAMVGAARHLMQTGFHVWHAYTQSDEISLLFAPEDATFAHKHRKLLSVLAGEASASLALDFGRTASVDCRLLELRDAEEVGDYFEWRRLDAKRNCAHSHAYLALRRAGADGGEPPTGNSKDSIARSRNGWFATSQASISKRCPRGKSAASGCMSNATRSRASTRSRERRAWWSAAGSQSIWTCRPVRSIGNGSWRCCHEFRARSKS